MRLSLSNLQTRALVDLLTEQGALDASIDLRQDETIGGGALGVTIWRDGDGTSWSIPLDGRRWSPRTRYAVVRSRLSRWDDAKVVAKYLPSNYRVLDTVPTDDPTWLDIVIAGEDVAGWTLDDYVIPRLGSGSLPCVEVAWDAKVARKAREAART